MPSPAGRLLRRLTLKKRRNRDNNTGSSSSSDQRPSEASKNDRGHVVDSPISRVTPYLPTRLQSSTQLPGGLQSGHRRNSSEISSSLSFLSDDTLDPPSDLEERRESLRAEYNLCFSPRPLIQSIHLRPESPLLRPSPLITPTKAGAEMASSHHLDPRAALARSIDAKGKERAINEARKMQSTVTEKAKKTGSGKDPGYEFLELIGKGSFGKVFKSVARATNQVVAVKIIDLDASDYKLNIKPGDDGDDTLTDFFRETEALKTLRERNARNINVIYDCFNFASEVWIVSEYCPGGSVSTLMQATPNRRFSEKYIIPIARELSEALRWVHGAGIIHRDVKASNVLVCEDGRVQLCDFGVSAILESKVNKRSTILGTPHWMPPEMLNVLTAGPNRVVQYSTEVDIWSFGCTLYELATGRPPNSTIAPENLRFAVKNQVPRLEGEEYSLGLRELVALCLDESPRDRPSIEVVHQHYYLFNTSRSYRTESLRQLLKDYKLWEQSGGQRQSLFMSSGGTMAPQIMDDEEEPWNFSTTEEFDASMAVDTYGDFDTSTPSRDLEISAHGNDHGSDAHRRVPINPLARMFVKDDPYNYLDRSRKMDDLPLRGSTENSVVRSSVINIPDFDVDPSVDEIPDLTTIRGHRSEWFKGGLDDGAENRESVYQLAKDDDRRGTMNMAFSFGEAEDPKMKIRPRTQDWVFPDMTGDNVEPPSSTESTFETVSAPASPPRPIYDVDDSVPRPSTADNAVGPISPDNGSFSFGNRNNQDPQFPQSMHRISRSGPPRVDSIETAKQGMGWKDRGKESSIVSDLPGFMRRRGGSLDDEGVDVGDSDSSTRLNNETRRRQRRELLHEWGSQELFAPKSTANVVKGQETRDSNDQLSLDTFKQSARPRQPSKPQVRLGDDGFPGMDRINAALFGNRRPPIQPLDDNRRNHGARDADETYQSFGATQDQAAGDVANHVLRGGSGRSSRASGVDSSESEITDYDEDDYAETDEDDGPGFPSAPHQLNLRSIPMPAPPSSEALSENGRPEVLERELVRVLTSFGDAMIVIRDTLESSMDPAEVPDLPVSRQPRRALDRQVRLAAKVPH
ncbi:MAG: hypothetical protein M1825_002797 [Sarcosagium campestre]|nr:MAG: hypothetical protein M1825_002797 [Sarcosagium campestre]